MNEKILTGKKNGLLVLLGGILLLILAVVGVVFGGIILDNNGSPVLFIISMIVVCLGWIPLCGLRVLGPQEALVLTLFGKYVGTLKGDGFFWVNPFCTAVNPAARTKLNQSGDVMTKSAVKTAEGQVG
ncbi:MAG: SPFH domain-containing protein, partial [Clostridia bacterium]|nr:SPFH domain-containing protein [Clostridia bacterium]